ncbi:B12-binding domain-containing radical SAM protein, partial [bacterium]
MESEKRPREMKIILLAPPARDFYDTELRLMPLGLCYLKAALVKHLPEIRVEVWDRRHGFGRRTATLPKELEYLKAFYPPPDRSPFCSFSNYFHFGAQFEDIAEEIKRAKPDLVGISNLFSAYHREALGLASAIKAALPVPIVMGGHHATVDYEFLLKSGHVDFAVLGEGEKPLVELAKALRDCGSLEKVPNLAFLKGREVFLTPKEPSYPLEELPFPDFSDFPTGKYRLGRLPLAQIAATRGCPAACSFCSVAKVFGKAHRRRSVENVISEMKLRVGEGYRAFDFEDDNLTLSKSWAAELLGAIISEFGEGEIALGAMNGVSYMALDEELLKLMRQAGFSHLNIALVTSSGESSHKAGRDFSQERFGEVAKTAHSMGFRTVAYQILGLPGESVGNMAETFAFLARLPVLMGASPFYLAPGSKLADELGPLAREDMVRCRLTAMGRDLESSKREDVFTFFTMTRIVNFLKGLSTGGQTVALEQAIDLFEKKGGRD